MEGSQLILPLFSLFRKEQRVSCFHVLQLGPQAWRNILDERQMIWVFVLPQTWVILGKSRNHPECGSEIGKAGLKSRQVGLNKVMLSWNGLCEVQSFTWRPARLEGRSSVSACSTFLRTYWVVLPWALGMQKGEGISPALRDHSHMRRTAMQTSKPSAASRPPDSLLQGVLVKWHFFCDCMFPLRDPMQRFRWKAFKFQRHVINPYACIILCWLLLFYGKSSSQVV